jgi:hypothetical protein
MAQVLAKVFNILLWKPNIHECHFNNQFWNVQARDILVQWFKIVNGHTTFRLNSHVLSLPLPPVGIFLVCFTFFNNFHNSDNQLTIKSHISCYKVLKQRWLKNIIQPHTLNQIILCNCCPDCPYHTWFNSPNLSLSENVKLGLWAKFLSEVYGNTGLNCYKKIICKPIFTSKEN